MSTTAYSPAVCYLPTNEAYDRWAGVYDTDGNFLQRIDDVEMKASLLPRLLDALQNQHCEHRIVVDLGCGTGRNTARLLSSSAAESVDEVVALDASHGMLDIARARLLSSASIDNAGEKGNVIRPRLHLIHHDLLSDPVPPEPARGTANAVISTLVLEHVPLKAFFAHVAAMLKPDGDGLLLLTNMHADMGHLSQAGFVDAETGVKIRPKSYAHTVAEVLAEADRWGFSVLVDDLIRGRQGGEEAKTIQGHGKRRYD